MYVLWVVPSHILAFEKNFHGEKFSGNVCTCTCVSLHISRYLLGNEPLSEPRHHNPNIAILIQTIFGVR